MKFEKDLASYIQYTSGRVVTGPPVHRFPEVTLPHRPGVGDGDCPTAALDVPDPAFVVARDRIPAAAEITLPRAKPAFDVGRRTRKRT